MSIKIFDPSSGKWVVQATNTAQDTFVVDGEGNYESNNVEEVLKEIAEEIDSLNDRVEYIYENGTIGGNNGTGGGGGGGSSNLPTLSLQSDATVSARTDETVDIYVLFATPNTGNGTLQYSISSVYSDSDVQIDNNVPKYESFTKTVTAGKLRVSIPGRKSGTHKVDIYVTDAAGFVSNSVSVTINSGALELRKITSEYFDDSADALFTDKLKLGFRVTALTTDPIRLTISKNGKIEERQAIIGVNEIDYGLVSDQFQDVGNHRIEIYASQGSTRSNTLIWNITVVDSENLVISSPLETNLTQKVGSTTAIEFRNSMQGYSRFLTKVSVTGGSLNYSTTLNSDIGINTWSLGTMLNEVGVTYVLTIQSFTISTTGGIGSIQSNILKFNVTITASDGYVPWKSVEDGAICLFEANLNNNNSTTRDIWRDKRSNNASTIVGKLNGFSYSDSSGWNSNKGCLSFSGKANVEFYEDETMTTKFCPFKGGIGSQGFTIDIRFKVQNIGDIKSRVLWCKNNITPFQGFDIGIDTAEFISDLSVGIEAVYKENEWVNITYVFYRPSKYNAQNQNMLILYINAVISKVVFLPSRVDNLTWKGPLLLGAMINDENKYVHYATCDVQALRIYNRALSDDEVLQNYISDHYNEEEQMAIRERNYGSQQIPTMTINCPFYDSMTDETAVDATITYNDPGDPSKNFHKSGCRLNWQGTSSRSYPVKNYTLRLRSGGNDWLTYRPKDDWMPEARYTLKANLFTTGSR